MEFKDLLPLLQGVSSPALVVLIAFAWNLFKQLAALTAALAEQTKKTTDGMHELDKRLAVIEDFIERDGNGNGNGTRRGGRNGTR